MTLGIPLAMLSRMMDWVSFERTPGGREELRPDAEGGGPNPLAGQRGRAGRGGGTEEIML